MMRSSLRIFGLRSDLPEFCGRALARTGVAEKKMAAGFGVHQAAAVNLNSQAVREVVGDQKLVGGILEGENGCGLFSNYDVKTIRALRKDGPRTSSYMDAARGRGW